MKFSAKDIAKHVNGHIKGDESTIVDRPATLENAGKGNISFYSDQNYEEVFYASKADIILVDESIKLKQAHTSTLILCKSPFKAFTSLIELAQKSELKIGIDKSAHIHKNASIGAGVYIGPNVVISEGVSIGKSVQIEANTFIGPNVVIGNNSQVKSGVNISNTTIGKNCIIHAGVVIGSDGFGFIPDQEVHKKVPHIGDVIIGDEVEIGANTTIDRGSIGSTIIGRGVKLDNLIQIAHNVEIGELTMIAAQSGIAGSTKIGKRCLIGGQVGLVGHITIADEVQIAAQSGILKSITTKGEKVQGSPAFELGAYKRAYVQFRNLEEIEKRLSKLEKK